jgi:hypothetical protein
LRAPAHGPQFCAPSAGDFLNSETMTDGHRAPPGRSWLKLILRDVHFWVPVGVLIGGLLVLQWIQ